MYFDLPSLEEYLQNFYSAKYVYKKGSKLETMNALCEHFNHPEHSCPSFHVTGSKGKGTIASGISALLRHMGYSTGVFSSPHVYHFTERVSTGAGSFSQTIYKKAEKELKEGLASFNSPYPLTWSEVTTIFAMLVFRQAKVDYVIYEVEIGGRYDVTNVISPLVIAVGPIELEHAKILGNTLAEIATEKAGVFKPQVPIISAPQAPEVRKIFKTQAAKNSTAVQYIKDASDYQILDAKIAINSVKQIFPDLDETKTSQIAAQVSLPGRYEQIENYKGIPRLLLDGAHTENSIVVVLDRMKKDGVYGNLIFACAADKNVEKMAEAIIKSRLFNRVYLTIPGDFKKSDFSRTKKAFEKFSLPIYSSSDYRSVIQKAFEDSCRTKTPLVVLGSFYLLPEIKKQLHF